MDFVVTLDSIMIHSGLLPDHLNHTAFGMNLLLFFSEKIARAWDFLSVLTLQDLSASLNPVTGVAELTSFIRLHSPFVALAITLALWGAVCLLLRPPRLFGLLLLAVLGTQESLVYHSAMVRTEFYSILFWSAAILLLAVALHTRVRWRALLLVVCGTLLGLCFLTKLQALFYVATFPFLLLLGSSLVSAKGTEARPRPSLALGTGLFNALFLSLLLVAAALTTLPQKVGVFNYDADGLDPAPYAWLLLVAAWGLFATQLVLFRRSGTDSALFRSSTRFVFVLCGFNLAFLLHFLIFTDPGRSLDYLLYDTKMLFFRGTYEETATLSGYVSNLRDLFRFSPFAMLAHAASLVLLFTGRRTGLVELSRRELLWIGLLSGMVLAQLALGTRWILRDVLYLEILLNLLTLVYLTLALGRAARWRKPLAAGSAALLVLLVGLNLHRGAVMTSRIDANYNLYGWWEGRWFTSVYRANHLEYRDLMERHYGRAGAAAVNAARLQARRHKEIRRTAAFVFKNRTITLRSIGLLWEGLPVWADEPAWLLERIPAELRNAIVVDAASARARSRHALEPEAVTTTSEAMDKLATASPDELVALKRRDLRIYLFAPEENLRELAVTGLASEPRRTAVVRNGDRSIELLGVEVANYVELPLDALGRRFFFVIRPS